MLNPAGLRRFPSPHSSLFFWIFGGIFGLKWGGKGRGGGYMEGLTPVARRGGDRPPCRARGLGPAVARGEGDRPPCRPLGGRQAPLFFYSRDFVANLKKKLHLNPVAPHRATGVYFWNFPKRTYIFEILIFLNIKKKKQRYRQCVGPYLKPLTPAPTHWCP